MENLKEWFIKILAKIDKIADFYGTHQYDIAQEECAELIQAISKLKRAKEILTHEKITKYIAAINLVAEEIRRSDNADTACPYSRHRRRGKQVRGRKGK